MNRLILLTLAIFFLLYWASLVNANDQHESVGERIKLSYLGAYKLGPYNSGAAEIASFDPTTKRVFVTNSHDRSVDVISLIKPDSPKLDFSINLTQYGAINSVAVKNTMVAIAVSAKRPQDNGLILLFSTGGEMLNKFTVGPMPDMVTFSADGKYLLSANEGEPNADYSIDPEGSISIIELQKDLKALSQESVQTADFKQFNRDNIDPNIRIFGKNASVAQDLEPEYISISPDSTTAWVSLQENNALAEVSLKHAQVKRLYALGYQDHSAKLNGFDASDKDQQINIKSWPVKGMYQPDSIATYEAKGEFYIVSANEGDARDYEGFSEQSRVKNLNLEPLLKSQNLQYDEQLGRLKVSVVGADPDQNGLIDTLYSFGSRSFSIWNQDVVQIYDSGSQFEQITARDYPKLFNLGDRRSDDKGPEPEALTIGKIGDSSYAFIGLERTGGIMTYNITEPENSFFVDYLNTISPHLERSDPMAGDIAPESLVFISAADSPSAQPLLIAANEGSGTLSIYRIDRTDPKD